MCVLPPVSGRESERERESVCVCICVCTRPRALLCVCACVCVCVVYVCLALGSVLLAFSIVSALLASKELFSCSFLVLLCFVRFCVFPFFSSFSSVPLSLLLSFFFPLSFPLLSSF